MYYCNTRDKTVDLDINKVLHEQYIREQSLYLDSFKILQCLLQYNKSFVTIVAGWIEMLACLFKKGQQNSIFSLSTQCNAWKQSKIIFKWYGFKCMFHLWSRHHGKHILNSILIWHVYKRGRVVSTGFRVSHRWRFYPLNCTEPYMIAFHDMHGMLLKRT